MNGCYNRGLSQWSAVSDSRTSVATVKADSSHSHLEESPVLENKNSSKSYHHIAAKEDAHYSSELKRGRHKSSDSILCDSLSIQSTSAFVEKWLSRRSALTVFCLKMTDIALTFICIGPLVSVFWYSTWTLADRYIFPNDRLLSYWLSAALGFSIVTSFTLLQQYVTSANARLSHPARLVTMRLFSYLLSVASINQWRAVWGLEDVYMGMSWLNALLTYLVSTFVLILLRGHRSCLNSPTLVFVDICLDTHYKMTTFCNTKPGASVYFLLDTVWTVFVVLPLTISAWRGLWELVDFQVCPDQVGDRMLWCLVGSYCLGLVLVILQRPLRWTAAFLETINWFLMLGFEEFIIGLYVVFTVASWRGIWLVFEVYAPLDTGYLWLYHVSTFIVLVAALAANSAMTQFSCRDGSLPDGKGVTLELWYLIKIFASRRSRIDDDVR